MDGENVEDLRAEVHLEQLQPAGAEQAGRLLAASHHSYPAFVQVFPDEDRRRRVLRLFMTASLQDAARFGWCQVARQGSWTLGVAAWMPPGAFPRSAVRKARMAPGLLRAALSAPRAFLTFAGIGARLEQALPDGRLWFLQAMGVYPDLQRAGIGTQLLTAGLERIDRQRAPAYLFTSDPANVDYYRRFGFTVSQPSVQVLAGGLAYIGMSRSPR